MRMRDDPRLGRKGRFEKTDQGERFVSLQTVYPSKEEAEAGPWEIVRSEEPYIGEGSGWMGSAFVHFPTRDRPEKYIWLGTEISKRELPQILRHEISHTKTPNVSPYLLGQEFEAVYYALKTFGSDRSREDLKDLFRLRRLWTDKKHYKNTMQMEREAAEAVGMPIIRTTYGYPKGAKWSDIKETE